MNRADRIVTLVFAKAPVAGMVKTRLAASLGAQAAAQLHMDLTRNALAVARAAKLGPVVLYCAPDCSHPFFTQCANEFGAGLQTQSAGDLGVRMHDALATGLESAEQVLLMGTDCPALDAAGLRAAASSLGSDVDMVFIPVEDGGYSLIGARRTDPSVFDGIVWGEPTVMQQTRERIRSLGWRWREQPALWDVDLPEDLERLQRFGLPWAAPGQAAPA